LVNFGGPWNGNCWYILCPFGIYYGHLVYFIAILYIFPRFGILLQEKTGNPGANPTTLSYNASVVKMHSATNSMARLLIKNYFSLT
jgi:hypothetical protein